MKRKNLISGFLAGTLVLTSVVIPGAAPVSAEEYDLTDGLVASYSFDDESLADGQGGAAASAIVTGLKAYSGDPEYIDGKSGKALQLGDYGLELNRDNLGDNFTVSFWIKPDGTLEADQSVMFLGWHSPEKWLAVAGDKDNSNQCRFWANGNGYSWTGLGTTDINPDGWHQLTITGSASGVTAYLDGEQWGSGNSNAPLVGENQDIYLGVTYWDTEFTGAVDEVKVYDRTLSAGEAYRLYDDETSAAELLDETGIAVTDSLSMVTGRTEKIDVSMHPVVADSDPVIAYESSDEKVAAVSQDGTVTAVGSGQAEITTSVTLGDVTETAITSVAVTGTLDDTLVASFDFDGSLQNSAGGEASALVTGLNAYTGDVVYEEGRDGGQAVRLGNYGLKLNQQDLGTEYTVSMWVKSDSVLAENQCVLFMGYHDPENWIAISGRQTGTSKVKFWGNGGVVGKWTTLANSSISQGDWHQITVTGTAGKTTLYMDGVSLGQAVSNDPLSGANADIYLGVNFWDNEFAGLVDDVKIYNIAMSAEEVQGQAPDVFQEAFEKQVDSALFINSLLGDNQNSANIVYDLSLPETLGDMSVSWSSDTKDVIADDGTVTSPSQETKVTLTATVTSGILSCEKEFTFTVKALDRSALEALIEEAEKIDTTCLTAESRSRLETAIQAAKDAENSYEAVEKAQAELQLAMDYLYYADEAVNPFAYLADPETEITMQKGETKDLFSIPEAISSYVMVEYASENDAVATYEDGTVKAVAEGKVIVTATVTAKYDGFKMEYSTAVEVAAAEPQEPTLDRVELTGPTKTEYIQGDELDLSGLTVKAVYSDGSSKEIAAGDYTVSGYDPNTVGEQTVTVTYEDKTADFTVTVQAKEEPTETPTPEPSEEPTETPTPGPSEEPTETPTPGPSQEPTGTPTPDPTGAPTGTGTPTSTPGAGGTQKPSGSGQGTAQGGQSAQTGDTSSMLATSVTAAGAALLLAAAVIVQRRRKNS